MTQSIASSPEELYMAYNKFGIPWSDIPTNMKEWWTQEFIEDPHYGEPEEDLFPQIQQPPIRYLNK